MLNTKYALPFAAILTACLAHAFAADAPDAACTVCGGLGILPNVPFKPYVRLDSAPPESTIQPAWKFCPKCQKGANPKTISEEMKKSQEAARVRHKEAVEASGMKMDLLLTPYAALHTNAPPNLARTYVYLLEKCAEFIQASTKSMRLTSFRPDTDDVYIVTDQNAYQVVIDKLRPELAPFKNFGMGAFVHCALVGKSNMPPESAIPAVFSQMALKNVMLHKTPRWLEIGFAMYSEWKMAGTNYAYYSTEQIPMSKQSFHEQLRKDFAKIRDWPALFELKYADLKAVDSFQCASIVAYLVELDPSRFDKLIRNIIESDDTVVDAIEKAYGRKIAELQSSWKQWAQKAK